MEYLNLSNNNIGADGATDLAKEFPNLLNIWFLHNNIGPEGAVSLAKGLNHLTKLKLLFLSNNNIDLNGATVIIKALTHCLDLHTVDMNLDSQKNFYSSIYLGGLIYHEDDAAIADLIAAAQHETQDRVLDLGFRVILVQYQQTDNT